MQSRFFTTQDGLRLHYIDHPCTAADSAGCCVLLHGFTNDAHVWDELARTLQASHRVIALDLRGHGDSDWDAQQRYSHWQLAEDVQDFLQQFTGEELHVVGHSLGARVAMLALQPRCNPVTTLTIVDAGPEVNADAAARLVSDVMQLPSSYVSRQAYLERLARIYVMADSRALAHVASFALRIRAGQLRPKTDPAFTPGIWHKNAEYRELDKVRGELGEQLWHALGTLEMPVHIVRGQASSILEQALALKMVKKLGTRASLSVVPRAGHAVMLDNPSQSTAFIAGFITRAGRTESNVKQEKQLEYQV